MDIEKLLTDLYENISDEAARANTRIFHTTAAIHASDLTQAFLEGYENTRKENPDLPEIPIEIFKKAADSAITEVHKRGKAGAASFWLDNNYKSIPPKEVYLGMKTLSNTPFNLLKTLGLKVINSYLRTAGAKQLISAKAVDGGVEGIKDTDFRTASHISHARQSTVGAARTLLAIKALEISNEEFANFISRPEAKELRDIFDSLDLSYSISTTKKGAIILNQDSPVVVSLQASSVNLSKVDTDASNLKKLFSTAVANFSKNNIIIPEDILEQDVEDYILNVFKTKILNPTTEIVQSYNRVTTNKYVKTKKVKGNRGKRTRPVGRLAKLAQNKKRRDSVSSNRTLAMLLHYLKSEIKQAVESRMNPKGPPSTLSEVLANQTGRFIEGVNVSSVSATKQNFLRVEYYYEKPYDTFQPGRAQGSKERDPRRLIGFSINDLINKFAQDRGWESSPFGRVYPVRLNMRAERGR